MEQEKSPMEMLNRLRIRQSALEDAMKEVQDKIKSLEKDTWMYGADRKVFGDIAVSCNSDSWKEAKEMKYDRVFYIQDNFLGNDHYATVSKQEAKELIKYMQDKTNYLETRSDLCEPQRHHN